ADIGPAIASTLDYEETLVNIGRLLVRDVADFCFIDLVEDDERVRRVGVAARDPTQRSLCEKLETILLDRGRPHLVGAALLTRRATLFEHVSEAQILSWAQSEEHLAALRGLRARSVMAVPLLAHDKLLGA